MARFFALVTAVLAAATIVSGQVSSPVGNTFQPGRGAWVGTSAAGALYFPDATGSVIVKVDPATGVQTIVSGRWGTTGATEGNTTDGAALWNKPEGLCTDGTDLFVADTQNHKLRKIVLATGQTSTVIGTGSASDAVGTGTAAGLNLPTDCQFVGTANLYVADSGNNKIKKVVAASGVTTVFSGAASGTITASDFTAGNANTNFRNPTGLCTDGTDLYVADSGNHGLRKVDGTTGSTTNHAGGAAAAASGFLDAAVANNIRLSNPTDCVYHAATAKFLVADKNNHAIRLISAPGTASTTYIGAGVAGSEDASAGADARLFSPIGIVGDAQTQSTAPTNVYITEQFSRVRKAVYGATTAGAVTTIGGLHPTTFPSNFYACAFATDYYCTDSQRHVVWKIEAASGLATVFAGTLDSPGDAEGAANTGKLWGPTGITTDGTTFAVSDTNNHKIRAIAANGVLSTPGGFGAVAGCYPNCAAGLPATAFANTNTQFFSSPKGLAYTAVGTRVLVADSGNHRVVAIPSISAAAQPVLVAGTSGTAGDATGAAGTSQLRSPEGVCVMPVTATNTEIAVLIADTGNNKLKAASVTAQTTPSFSVSTTALTTSSLLGNTGSAGATEGGDISTGGLTALRYRSPKACACDSEAAGTAATYCFVADSGNNKVKKVTLATGATTILGAADGTFAAGNVAGSTLTALKWNNPSAIVRLTGPAFLVTDTGNRQLKHSTDAGVVIPNPAANVFPSLPSTTNANTQTFGVNPGTVGTAPAAEGHIALFNGVREAASLLNVAGVETAYLVDSANHAIRRVVYNITSGRSTVTPFLGTVGTSGDSVTSGSVSFNAPTAIVANGTDTLYVADTGNHKIKKIVVAADGTATVTVFAGPAAGTQQAADVIASDATVRFSSPQGLAIAGGNLFVADTGNNKIKQITPAGAVTIVWGAAATGTGAATAAGDVNSATAASNTFSAPKGLASNGTHIFVADSGSNKIRICTVGSGTCANFAGPAQGTTTSGNADAAPGSFNSPSGLSFDQFGNLYVADTNNHKIRKITPAGVITSVVGTAGGTAGTAGAADQTTAASAVGGSVYATATLSGPTFVWFARSQPTLAFISDTTNNKVRVAAGLGSAAVTVTATATQTNTTTTTVTNTTTATVTTTANTTTAATTSTASNATTVAPTTTAARGSSNAVVAAATAVIVAVLAIFA